MQLKKIIIYRTKVINMVIFIIIDGVIIYSYSGQLLDHYQFDDIIL